MKTIKHVFVLSFILCGVLGCTSTTIIPSTGDMRTVVSEADSSQAAIEIATNKANDICKAQDKTPNILDIDTIKQDPDQIKQTLAKLAKNIDHSETKSLPSNYDYQSTLTFKCK